MANKQIELWRGEFGNDYRERNKELPEVALRSRVELWHTLIHTIYTTSINKDIPISILEVGAGLGVNLIAINALYNNNPSVDLRPLLYAIETNEETCASLTSVAIGANTPINVFNASAERLPFDSASMDLVFTSGVLIHIHPDNLKAAMDEIYRVSKKYIVCIEYFDTKCTPIEYRGEKEALWKNDYGSIWLDNYPLKCKMCTFAWKRTTGLDNLTIWLFEKVN